MSDYGVQRRPIIINLSPVKRSLETEPECRPSPLPTSKLKLSEVEHLHQTSSDNDTSFGDESDFSSSSGDSDVVEEDSIGIKRRFVEGWKFLFPFIEYDKEKNVMFCKICREFSTHRQKGIRFVMGTDNFRASSIHYHQKSALHARCQMKANSVLDGNSDPMELMDSDRKKLVQVLKLVYFMIKTRSPFTYFPQLCRTQINQGLEVGPAYTSHQKVVPFFSKYIALDLEMGLSSEKLSELGPFSLILDNSFSRAVESHELVYINILKEDNQPKSIFLGVIESGEKSGSFIYENLCKLFLRFNVTEWVHNVTFIMTDTFCNRPLWLTGLINILKEKSDNFISDVNFLPHKVKRCSKVFEHHTSTSECSVIIYDIFWYYDKIPEDQKELSHIESVLNSVIQEYGKIPKEKWVVFSLNALEAVNKDWFALVKFLNQYNDSVLDSKVRKMGAKILSLITRSKFLWTLAFVLDIFTSLNNFSDTLQDVDLMPFSLSHELDNLRYSIRGAVNGKGIFFQSFEQEMHVSMSTFRNIPILFDSTSTGVLNDIQDLGNDLVTELNGSHDCRSFLESCQILCTRNWPQDIQNFGNADFSELYSKVQGREQHLQTTLSEWSSFKTHVGACFSSDVLRKPYITFSNAFASKLPTIMSMFKKLRLLNFCWKEVDKGYREMNLLKSSERSMLSVTSLQSLMVIAMHGSPLAQFNPFPAMQLWMKECTRRYHTRSKHKIKNSSIMSNCNSFLQSFNELNTPQE